MLSLIVPVYDNFASLPELMRHVEEVRRGCGTGFEAVFVVDASPDGSYAWLKEHLPQQPFASKLLLLARNFGSFAAIRAGMNVAEGECFTFMAADLQEPPQAVLDVIRPVQKEEADVSFGQRINRGDPAASRLCSALFWKAYRKLVQPEMPEGGADLFACNRRVRDHLLQCGETNSSLVGLLLWMGFRRATVPYTRVARKHGKSSWKLRRKLRYMLDSMLAFSDLPILLLLGLGLLGLVVAVALSVIVFLAKISGLIAVPGYAATIIVLSFFAGLNSLGLGIIGAYVWRTFENTKKRPAYLVAESHEYLGKNP